MEKKGVASVVYQRKAVRLTSCPPRLGVGMYTCTAVSACIRMHVYVPCACTCVMYHAHAHLHLHLPSPFL